MRVHLLIGGKVQGVFYRAFIKKKADELGLSGWVKNRDDGQVEAVFEGPKEKVEQMIRCCWQGTKASQVKSVKTVPAFRRASETEDVRHNAGIKSVKTRETFQRFEIRY